MELKAFKDAPNLEAKQKRENNQTPIEQAFGYRSEFLGSPFVIVSNFYEFRLYFENKMDYNSWTLHDLINPDENFKIFRGFYFLLNAHNFTAPAKKRSKTLELLDEKQYEQEEIGNRFYELYSQRRIDLLKSFQEENPVLQADTDLAIELTQKVLDRIIFISFAENNGLLPKNTLPEIPGQHEQLPPLAKVSLWSMLQGLFRAIDQGDEGLEIPQYNGGLFAKDPRLDDLNTSDDVIRKTLDLANFQYQNDLSVTILGHILEQSITDIEEIKQALKNSDADVEEIGRRRRQGVFYTPDNIVNYIIEQTLGTFLNEKENAFLVKHKVHGARKDSTRTERRNKAYYEYLKFLSYIKIVDPACGSGAFLVGVVDYLVHEHMRVAQELNIDVTENQAATILQNNIYGVDLNPESVEITKLSLWLKTAEKGKKLTALDDNIKCGNSLISDTNIVGDRAFNWQNEFSNTMKNVAFDVVVGNPPYVSAVNMSKTDEGKQERKYISKHFSSAKGAWDLYIPFVDLGIELLAPDGKLGYITANQWMSEKFGEKLREDIFPGLELLVDCSKKVIFDSASVTNTIFTLNKAGTNKLTVRSAEEHTFPITKVYEKGGIEDELYTENLALLFSPHQKLISKIGSRYVKELENINIRNTGDPNSLYTFKTQTENSEFSDLSSHLKVVNTGTIEKYYTKWGYSPLKLLKEDYFYPVISRNDFSSYMKNKPEILGPKLITTGNYQLRAYFDAENEYAPLRPGVIISGPEQTLLSLTGILNSAVIEFFSHEKYYASVHHGMINFNKPVIETMPLPVNIEMETKLPDFVRKVQKMHNELQKQNNYFWKMSPLQLKSDLGPKVYAKTYAEWFNKDFSTLKKQSVMESTSRKEQQEFLDLFEEYAPHQKALTAEIEQVEASINTRVFELFDMSANDRKIVEEYIASQSTKSS